MTIFMEETISKMIDDIAKAKEEALLSEIRQARYLGNWKRANDLRKHYAKLVKKKMRA